jgi:hypothetical protein
MLSESDYQQEKSNEEVSTFFYNYFPHLIQNQQQQQQMATTTAEDDEIVPSAELYIAEMLQHHLYKPSEFLKNLLQETLLSLAQNGSLLGLTHLLVLVLLVIKR